MNKKTIWTKDMEKIILELKETKLNAEEISMIMNIPTLDVEKQLNTNILKYYKIIFCIYYYFKIL
jgi:hypothetical protein